MGVSRSLRIALACAIAPAAGCSLLLDTSSFSTTPAEDAAASAPDGRDVADALPGDSAHPADDGSDDGGSDTDGSPAETIAFLQAREGNTGTGTSLPITFGQPVTAHDAIIVCVSIYTTAVTITGITDTVGNTYTTILGPYDAYSTRHYIAVAYDTKPGADTVTVSVSGNPSPYLGVHVHEYAGLATANAFDVGSFASGTTAAVDGMASGAKMTTADHELVFGYGVSSDTSYPGTGYNARSGFSTGDVTEDRVVRSKGLYQATATMTIGNHWEMLMATFKAQ